MRASTWVPLEGAGLLHVDTSDAKSSNPQARFQALVTATTTVTARIRSCNVLKMMIERP
jgi:hypothetical protein